MKILEKSAEKSHRSLPENSVIPAAKANKKFQARDSFSEYLSKSIPANKVASCAEGGIDGSGLKHADRLNQRIVYLLPVLLAKVLASPFVSPAYLGAKSFGLL